MPSLIAPSNPGYEWKGEARPRSLARMEEKTTIRCLAREISTFSRRSPPENPGAAPGKWEPWGHTGQIPPCALPPLGSAYTRLRFSLLNQGYGTLKVQFHWGWCLDKAGVGAGMGWPNLEALATGRPKPSERPGAPLLLNGREDVPKI